MPEVIYARVADELKEAAESFAKSRGTTLTTAVSELLSRGLEAAANEGSVAELERRVRELTARLQEALSAIQLYEQRDQQWSSAYAALAERLEQPLGLCTACRKPARGYDLLVTGACRECGAGLASLFSAPREGADLDRNALAVLLGAVGLFVAIALRQPKQE
jgi:antitoxin component of RelBE/YafQ-DinJ toxin-antitoxin module